MKTILLPNSRPVTAGLLLVTLIFNGLPSLHAQAKQPEPAQLAQEMQAAHEFRSALTDGIVAGKHTPQAALELLRGRRNAMGLGHEASADLAFALSDVAQRLLAKGQPEKAELFFKEADQALGQAINRLPDAQAETKAMLLEQRAHIRAEYLNRAQEADADLEKASELQPEDQRVKRKRELLAPAKTGRKDKSGKSN